MDVRALKSEESGNPVTLRNALKQTDTGSRISLRDSGMTSQIRISSEHVGREKRSESRRVGGINWRDTPQRGCSRPTYQAFFFLGRTYSTRL